MTPRELESLAWQQRLAELDRERKRHLLKEKWRVRWEQFKQLFRKAKL